MAGSPTSSSSTSVTKDSRQGSSRTYIHVVVVTTCTLALLPACSCQLEEIKAARGLNVDDGTAAADKPLAEVLAERKKAKQDAFDDQWKQMKTGKNRPLDPDELDFLDALARHEARQLNNMQQQEEAELQAYREAVVAAAEAKAAAAAATGGGEGAEEAAAAAGPGLGNALVLGRSESGAAAAATKLSSKTNSKAAGSVVKPVLKVKAKTAARHAGAQSAGHSSKRLRLESDVQQQQQHSPDAAGGAGLAGFLGEYGSASDEENS